ncbi:MAG TPA: HEAT repeat domain-containing protein [Archangium sp.]|jgi:hypothetical protein|uniref:HEAT repeat domain-containing protein n=1 Tax=Archangium sp. TaxID=1872627 RepID=UPI002ED99052
MRDFAEIARLDTEVLRSLLEAGEAPERVRAAWALALRLGGTLRPELIQGSLTEPHPGVRRHLVVVLAGYQERAVLATLARQDLDGEVRAVACQYLSMIGRPEDAESWRVLHERLEADVSAEVRRAAIAYLPPHTPAFLRSAVASRVGDESLDVRRAAADKLLEWSGLSGGGLPDVLVSRFHLEPDPELRREWVRRACSLGGERALLAALLDAREGTLQFVLELYVAQRIQLPWECLRPVARRGHPGLDALLMDLLAPGAQPEADAWLLEVALRFWRESSQDYDDAVAWAAEGALKCLDERLEAGHLTAPDARGNTRARELRDALVEARRRALEYHLTWCEESEHGECFDEDWSLDGMMDVLLGLSPPGDHPLDG